MANVNFSLVEKYKADKKLKEKADDAYIIWGEGGHLIRSNKKRIDEITKRLSELTAEHGELIDLDIDEFLSEETTKRLDSIHKESIDLIRELRGV